MSRSVRLASSRLRHRACRPAVPATIQCAAPEEDSVTKVDYQDGEATPIPLLLLTRRRAEPATPQMPYRSHRQTSRLRDDLRLALGTSREGRAGDGCASGRFVTLRLPLTSRHWCANKRWRACEQNARLAARQLPPLSPQNGCRWTKRWSSRIESSTIYQIPECPQRDDNWVSRCERRKW